MGEELTTCSDARPRSRRQSGHRNHADGRRTPKANTAASMDGLDADRHEHSPKRRPARNVYVFAPPTRPRAVPAFGPWQASVGTARRRRRCAAPSGRARSATSALAGAGQDPQRARHRRTRLEDRNQPAPGHAQPSSSLDRAPKCRMNSTWSGAFAVANEDRRDRGIPSVHRLKCCERSLVVLRQVVQDGVGLLGSSPSQMVAGGRSGGLELAQRRRDSSLWPFGLDPRTKDRLAGGHFALHLEYRYGDSNPGFRTENPAS